MIDTDNFFKWIPFIIYPITHIKNKFIQFVLILSFFIICYMSTNYWSKKSQNQKFKEFVQEKLEYDKQPMSYIMQHGVINFNGEDSLIEIALFFTHLMEVNLDIYAEYKNKVKIWQVVVNEMPSYVYQLNGETINDANIKKTDSMVKVINRDVGFDLLKDRRYKFDINPIVRHLSIYWKDGVNQKTFEQNIQNTNGVHFTLNINNNKNSFKKELSYTKGKINGLKINNPQIIEKHLYGQFTVMKKDTGAILVFKESYGEQYRKNNTTTINKHLQFFYCENKHDIIKFDKKLYELMFISGILDDL